MQREKKLDDLRQEIRKCYEEYKKERKSYEIKVRLFNFILSILPITITVILILSSVFDTYARIFNALGLLCSILFIVFSYMAKNSGYDAKLIQRGTTYFALCNLSRKIRLEMKPEDKYEEFAKEFQNIMEHENEMSLLNSLETVNLFRKYYQKGLEQEQSMRMQNQGENQEGI